MRHFASRIDTSSIQAAREIPVYRVFFFIAHVQIVQDGKFPSKTHIFKACVTSDNDGKQATSFVNKCVKVNLQLCHAIMGIVEVFLNPQVKFLLLQANVFGVALDYFLGDVICQDEPTIAA
jgi:hypothetical protein